MHKYKLTISHTNSQTQSSNTLNNSLTNKTNKLSTHNQEWSCNPKNLSNYSLKKPTHVLLEVFPSPYVLETLGKSHQTKPFATKFIDKAWILFHDGQRIPNCFFKNFLQHQGKTFSSTRRKSFPYTPRKTLQIRTGIRDLFNNIEKNNEIKCNFILFYSIIIC